MSGPTSDRSLAAPRSTVRAALLAALVALAPAGPAQANHAGMFTAPVLATTDGGAIFRRICQGCHMADARGATGAGRYPALAGDPKLASRRYVALTVLAGRRNMPAFGKRHAVGMFYVPATLTDVQIAAVINYLRTHFGNRYRDRLTAAEVRELDRTVP